LRRAITPPSQNRPRFRPLAHGSLQFFGGKGGIRRLPAARKVDATTSPPSSATRGFPVTGRRQRNSTPFRFPFRPGEFAAPPYKVRTGQPLSPISREHRNRAFPPFFPRTERAMFRQGPPRPPYTRFRWAARPPKGPNQRPYLMTRRRRAGVNNCPRPGPTAICRRLPATIVA